MISNVTFNGKTLKLKNFVTRNTNNLMETNWMEKFKLYNMPINLFCKIPESLTNETYKFKKKLKAKFPEVFSGGLGRCNKMFAKFELQEKVIPVFTRKRNVPFASLIQISDELDRLESMGVLSKVKYSEWDFPVVSVRKKTKEIGVRVDFSTGRVKKLLLSSSEPGWNFFKT